MGQKRVTSYMDYPYNRPCYHQLPTAAWPNQPGQPTSLPASQLANLPQANSYRAMMMAVIKVLHQVLLKCPVKCSIAHPSVA